MCKGKANHFSVWHTLNIQGFQGERILFFLLKGINCVIAEDKLQKHIFKLIECIHDNN